MEFDNLGVVNNTKKDWHVKVRVTRMWQTKSFDEGILIGTHLVILDSQVCETIVLSSLYVSTCTPLT